MIIGINRARKHTLKNQMNHLLPQHKAKENFRLGIVQSIIDSLERESRKTEQARSLRAALAHKSLKIVVEEAGFVESEKEDKVTALTMIGNTQRFLFRALRTKNPRCRSSDYQRSTIESIQVAFVATPKTKPNMPTQSGERQPNSNISKQGKDRIMNILLTTFIRNEKKVKTKHLKFKLGTGGVLWSSICPRQKWSKISHLLLEQLHK